MDCSLLVSQMPVSPPGPVPALPLSTVSRQNERITAAHHPYPSSLNKPRYRLAPFSSPLPSISQLCLPPMGTGTSEWRSVGSVRHTRSSHHPLCLSPSAIASGDLCSCRRAGISAGSRAGIFTVGRAGRRAGISASSRAGIFTLGRAGRRAGISAGSRAGIFTGQSWPESWYFRWQ